MALSDAYATPQQYRDAIRKTDEEEDHVIGRNLITISRYIEKKTHDFYNKSEDALETRIFDPVVRYTSGRISANGIGFAESENPWVHMRGDIYLTTDPIADLTGLVMEVDINRDNTFSQLLTPTDYIALPRNATVGPEPKPYRHFQRGYVATPWAPGAAVRIAAVWGWPAVPSAIVDCTIEIAAILRIESIRATARMNEMDNTMEASNECQAIIHRLLLSYRAQASLSI